MGEEAVPVTLHVYDLSNGLARALSMQLLGKQVEETCNLKPVLWSTQRPGSQLFHASQPFCTVQIDGVWHTAVVVHGTEHYYGGGLQQAVPGQTPFGPPFTVIELG